MSITQAKTGNQKDCKRNTQGIEQTYTPWYNYGKIHNTKSAWHWQHPSDHILAFTQTSTEVMQHFDAI